MPFSTLASHRGNPNGPTRARTAPYQPIRGLTIRAQNIEANLRYLFELVEAHPPYPMTSDDEEAPNGASDQNEGGEGPRHPLRRFRSHRAGPRSAEEAICTLVILATTSPLLNALRSCLQHYLPILLHSTSSFTSPTPLATSSWHSVPRTSL
jgi:hypothetical protein